MQLLEDDMQLPRSWVLRKPDLVVLHLQRSSSRRQNGGASADPPPPPKTRSPPGIGRISVVGGARREPVTKPLTITTSRGLLAGERLCSQN
ncbi:hypothetical protein GQ53DRAFT_404142 [Thozetella sp. PMI_491]|nr:hypothetical protein GQ53DRAFT_404142 [Thozetella sp. PMI_491]